jgi:hypothetical protein
MTGLSRAQLTRLIRQYQQGEPVRVKPYRRRRFPLRHTRADIERLAQVDEARKTLSGPATQKVLQPEYYDFGDQRYRRLARLSVAHLYRLRPSRTYWQRRVTYQPTRPTPEAIGGRRPPQPDGHPDDLRVDTVTGGRKRLYHINPVDEVTQWQVVGATTQISEAWLIPVLEAMLAQFPLPIRGFHSDNGSELINHTVARLLNKLLMEQTKSRPRQANKNAWRSRRTGRW